VSTERTGPFIEVDNGKANLSSGKTSWKTEMEEAEIKEPSRDFMAEPNERQQYGAFFFLAL
jgi:hypothetical protein